MVGSVIFELSEGLFESLAVLSAWHHIHTLLHTLFNRILENNRPSTVDLVVSVSTNATNI